MCKYSIISWLFVLQIFTWSCSKDKEDVQIPPTVKFQSNTIYLQALASESDHGVPIGIESNTDWTIQIIDNGDSWLKVSKLRGLSGNDTITIKANVSNQSHEDRMVSLIVKAGSASDTLQVIQKYEGALILTSKVVQAARKGESLNVELTSNIQYDITILGEGKQWIDIVPVSKALVSTKHLFTVKPNEGKEVRQAQILFKDRTSNLADTLSVYQSGNQPGVYFIALRGTLASVLGKEINHDTTTYMKLLGSVSLYYDLEDLWMRYTKLRILDLSELDIEAKFLIPFGSWQNGEETLEKILLPDNLNGIGNNVFRFHHKLSGVMVLPSQLEFLGQSAFYDCPSLTGLVVGDKLEGINSTSFWKCTGLKYLNLGNSIETIGQSAFYGCSGITGTLLIPNSVKRIERYAFKDCSSAEQLVLSDNLEYIGISAFDNCSSLTGELILPAGVTVIEERTFALCRFTDIKMSPSITKIGSYAFGSCDISKVDLNEGLKTIGSAAFAGCQKLTTVSIPSTVEIMESSIFSGCISLKNLKVAWTTPIEHPAGQLVSNPSETTLYVPIASINAYKIARGWKEFKIVGY